VTTIAYVVVFMKLTQIPLFHLPPPCPLLPSPPLYGPIVYFIATLALLFSGENITVGNIAEGATTVAATATELLNNATAAVGSAAAKAGAPTGSYNVLVGGVNVTYNFTSKLGSYSDFDVTNYLAIITFFGFLWTLEVSRKGGGGECEVGREQYRCSCRAREKGVSMGEEIKWCIQ
jgi:hypothetical protein